MALTTSLADLSVLLVEPSHMQAALVSRMLEHQGVRKTTVVETASAALAALKAESKFVIVISSLYLPDLAPAASWPNPSTSSSCRGRFTLRPIT